ncbi:hypothetical protein XI01_17175 [Bradyrhizobium sp. CCBAU 21360]|nr:hypothetical protein [Bradyrhizobium sp. CCBAU 21360]
MSAEALAKAEAIQNLSAVGFWIASSQELLAITEQGASSASPRSQRNSQTRLRALAARFARGLLSFALLEDQRAQGRPGAGGTRKSVRDRNAHGVDYR